jgi:hypothetical protein
VPQVVAEVGQHVTFDARIAAVNPAAANVAGATVSADRGIAHARGGVIDYTSRGAPGLDVIHVTLCSAGDPTACITTHVPVAVAPTFTLDRDTTAVVTTDKGGTATFPIPTRGDAGPLNPATITITSTNGRGTITVAERQFRLQLSDPTYVGGDTFTWRACAAANRDNCRSSTVHLSINNGFGWAAAERHVVAGLTTTLDVPSIAADAARWGLNVGSITVTGPADITIAQTGAGQYRIGTPAGRHDPFTLRICGEGRNGVPMCSDVRYLVTPLTILPKQHDLPGGSNHHAAAPLLSAQPVTAPSAPPTQPKAAAAHSGGVDITWWVIGAAMIFGVGGGAGALRNRS